MSLESKREIKEFIIKEAKNLGFDKIGFAKITEVERADKFKEWLENGYHASMSWMENYSDKRVNPALLMNNAKTMICFATNHYKEIPYDENKPYIAKYALSDDYHDILKNRLKELYLILKKKIPSLEGRYFTDTAPILERYWAEKAGLGWQGKNSLLITRDLGSYLFLSEMIINIELEADEAHKNYCGSCTNCIEACPTDAIVEPYIVNSEDCISYLTIEKREEFEKSEASKVKNHIFGCDICQEICPWNKFAKSTKDMHFMARDELLDKDADFWRFLTEDQFKELFQKSAIKRTKYSGFMRNARAVQKNIGKLD